MNLIEENLNGINGTFYEKLSEDCLFDFELFYSLVNFIDDLSKSNLDTNIRLQNSNELWELGFRIQSCISSSFNESDVYNIDNLNVEQLVGFNSVIGYICKSFSDNIKLDIDFIKVEIE